MSENSLRWHKENPDRVREHRSRWAFGMSPQDVAEMIAAQDGRCPICKRTIPPAGRSRHIDHNHTTGRVRGVLCQPCNVALGHVQENVETLRRMIAYIEADIAAPTDRTVNVWIMANKSPGPVGLG